MKDLVAIKYVYHKKKRTQLLETFPLIPKFQKAEDAIPDYKFRISREGTRVWFQKLFM